MRNYRPYAQPWRGSLPTPTDYCQVGVQACCCQIVSKRRRRKREREEEIAQNF